MAEGGEDGNGQAEENLKTNSTQYSSLPKENPTATINDSPHPPQPDSKPQTEELVASTPSSVTSNGESDPPLVPPIPSPSVAAALGRGSYFGDANPRRASIAEVLAAAQPNQESGHSITTEQTSSLPESDAASTVSEVEEEQQLTNESRVYIMGFLRGMLERLELMAILPGADSVTNNFMPAIY